MASLLAPASKRSFTVAVRPFAEAFKSAVVPRFLHEKVKTKTWLLSTDLEAYRSTILKEKDKSQNINKSKR
jgi:hypothetical protein